MKALSHTQSGLDLFQCKKDKFYQRQTRFTYALSEGVDKYHYYLQYVGVDRKVHIHNVRIHYEKDIPIFYNAVEPFFAKIDELILACLKCSPSICKPLSQQAKQLNVNPKDLLYYSLQGFL